MIQTKEQQIKELERWIHFAQFLMMMNCGLLAAELINKIEVEKVRLDYGDK